MWSSGFLAISVQRTRVLTLQFHWPPGEAINHPVAGVSSTTTDWGLTFQGFLHRDDYPKSCLTSYQEQRLGHKIAASVRPHQTHRFFDCLLASQEQAPVPGWRNWVVTAGLQAVPSTWGCHQQSCPCPRDRHPCGAAQPREDGQAAPTACQRAQSKAAPRTAQAWHICTTTPAKKKYTFHKYMLEQQ